MSFGQRVFLFLPLLAGGLAPTAFAQEGGTDSKVAIQRRKFQMAHEFAFSLGVMPEDPFQKGLTGSFSYTVHFNNYFAWELFRATASYLTSTNLRDELISTFAIPPEDFAAPRFMATTGVEFSPFYGKLVLFNDTVVHQSLFLGLHAGVVFGDRADITGTLKDFRPAAGLGLGYRVFLSKTTSLRFDARGFLSLKRAIRTNESFEIDSVIHLTAALAFNLWRDDA